MIKWKWIGPGEYESEDGRFHIIKTWDNLWNHWLLFDRNVPYSYNGFYYKNTLIDCKLKAEAIS